MLNREGFKKNLICEHARTKEGRAGGHEDVSHTSLGN